MEFKDCTVGTKVQIKGTICEVFDKLKSVALELKGGHKFLFGYDFFERDVNQYDPKRKFRKGDIVRINYRGREMLLSMLPEGKEYEVLQDETPDGKVFLKTDESIVPDGSIWMDFSRLDLIQQIEKRPCPYYIDEGRTCFKIRVKLKDKINPVVYCVFFGAGTGVTKDEARLKAQDLWFEKRREYRESLKN